jgi:glycosyltransferase involved in cell wall biosynthesis
MPPTAAGTPAAGRPADPLLSVVLPIFDEAAVLPEMARRLAMALDAIATRWEVICVDDGSRDASLDELRRLHAGDPRFRVVSFARNFGHQVAVSAGLAHARGDAVAVLDADLQDPPEVLALFLARWREGYDVVYGVREKRKEGVWKRTAYHLFYLLLRRLVDFPIPLDSGDFSLMDRRVVDAINELPERARFVRGLRAWVGFPQIAVAYERHARAAGRTKYPLPKLLKLAFDGIVNFSNRPLSLIASAGFLTAIGAFLGLVFFLLHRFIGFKIFGYSPQDVPGFTSVILSVLFIGGLQLTALGLIGEYIGRIFIEVKRRPLYVTKEVLDSPPPGAPTPSAPPSP